MTNYQGISNDVRKAAERLVGKRCLTCQRLVPLDQLVPRKGRPPRCKSCDARARRPRP